MRTLLNDLDLQRLKAENPSISGELAWQFEEVLNSFITSARFPLLKTFEIGHFLGSDSLGLEALDQSSFEALANMSTYSVCTLEGISAEKLKQLVDLLQNLSIDDGLDDTASFLRAEDVVPVELGDEVFHGDSEQTDYLLTPFGVHASPTAPGEETGSRPRRLLSSIEAERLLRDAFGRLRALPDYQIVRSELVGSYWDPEGVRAPFIEAMTFGQLAEMTLANLLEKRTFTDQKVLCVVKAIDIVCEGHAGNQSSDTLSRERPNSRGELRSVSAWDIGQDSFPPVAAALVRWCEAESALALGTQDFVSQLAAVLPTLLSAKECLSLWKSVSRGETVPSALLGLEDGEIEELSVQGAKKLDTYFQEHNAGLRSLWLAVLAGPGVSERELFQNSRGSCLNPDFESLVLRFLLWGLAAQQPAYHGLPVERHWTCNPELFETVMRSLLSELPIDDNLLRQRMAVLLPLFETDAVTAALRAAVEFDETRQRWTKKNS